MRVFNFIFGILIGFIIGAAIILLTTPQSGEDVQQGVKNRLTDLQDVWQEAFAARKAELESRMVELQTATSVKI